MTLWELMKAGRAKKLVEAEEKKKMENPLDRGLPFMFHIDGKITINTLLPDDLNPLFQQGDHIIQGFSQFNLMGYKCFRVLLHHQESDTESYLLIFQRDVETFVRWFVKYDEQFPSDQGQWDFWLSDVDGSIGLNQFKLMDGTLFNRIWGGSQGRHIDPLRFSERLILDRHDDSNSKNLEHRSMLYGREVPDKICPCDQFVLLSASEETGGSYVSIDVGVDLDINSNIEVVY